MDWSKGYGASYYMTRLDAESWRELERVELKGGQIRREVSGLRMSADADCVNYPHGTEEWVRVYLDAKQGGDGAHEALFTGLAIAPDDEYSGRLRSNRVQCFSVLKPVDDVFLTRGWYAPAGVSGTTIIKQLLSVTPAPVIAEDGAPALHSSIIAEDGETKLTMIDKILEAINWRLRIAGDGTISIEPARSDVAAVFDPLENDVIETEVKVSADWYSCPNVFMAIDDDLTAIARDDSPESPLSTISRGREVWAQDTSCDLADNETIAEYAARRLKEEQRSVRTASYDRRYVPDVYPGDMVRLRCPAQTLDGVFMVESQSIEIDHAARTSERITEA